MTQPPPTEGRMKLTILGGFLGCGKTTWLRHQLHHGRFKNAYVVINEAADIPVDDAILAGSTRLAVLAGGCACCEARDGLVALLRDLCDQRVGARTEAEQFNEIILETSGLADPGAIVDAIKSDPVLVHHILLGSIVVAVDGLHCLDQLRREPTGRRQVETADQLVVTKIDETAQAVLPPLLATLRKLNPAASISGAIKGSSIALPSFDDAQPEDLPELGVGSPEPVHATHLLIEDDVDWTAFTVWLSALLHARGDDIVRVKGIVRTPAGRLLLQSVRKMVQSPEILPEIAGAGHEGDDNTIVLIGRGFEPADLSRSLRSFAV